MDKDMKKQVKNTLIFGLAILVILAAIVVLFMLARGPFSFPPETSTNDVVVEGVNFHIEKNGTKYSGWIQNNNSTDVIIKEVYFVTRSERTNWIERLAPSEKKEISYMTGRAYYLTDPKTGNEIGFIEPRKTN